MAPQENLTENLTEKLHRQNLFCNNETKNILCTCLYILKRIRYKIKRYTARLATFYGIFWDHTRIAPRNIPQPWNDTSRGRALQSHPPFAASMVTGISGQLMSIWGPEQRRQGWTCLVANLEWVGNVYICIRIHIYIYSNIYLYLSKNYIYTYVLAIFTFKFAR